MVYAPAVFIGPARFASMFPDLHKLNGERLVDC